jgi:hypothetical protein
LKIGDTADCKSALRSQPAVAKLKYRHKAFADDGFHLVFDAAA